MIITMTSHSDMKKYFNEFNIDVGSDFSASTSEVKYYTCHNCDGLMLSSNGIRMCDTCGHVAGEEISDGAEWRMYSTDCAPRCGMPIDNMMPDYSRSVLVNIPRGKKDVNAFREVQRLVKWTSIGNKEKSLRERLDNIMYRCTLSNVPVQLIEYTKTIYHDLIERYGDTNGKAKRGFNSAGLQAVALYYAYQKDGTPKTYADVAKVFDIDVKYVSDAMSVFKEVMAGEYDVRVNDTNDFIDNYCNRMMLSQEVTDRVKFIADKATKMRILERNTPSAVVAGCVSYVAQEQGLNITKDEIKEHCGVSIPTISIVTRALLDRALEFYE